MTELFQRGNWIHGRDKSRSFPVHAERNLWLFCSSSNLHRINWHEILPESIRASPWKQNAGEPDSSLAGRKMPTVVSRGREYLLTLGTIWSGSWPSIRGIFQTFWSKAGWIKPLNELNQTPLNLLARKGKGPFHSYVKHRMQMLLRRGKRHISCVARRFIEKSLDLVSRSKSRICWWLTEPRYDFSPKSEIFGSSRRSIRECRLSEAFWHWRQLALKIPEIGFCAIKCNANAPIMNPWLSFAQIFGNCASYLRLSFKTDSIVT
jgi:hypothetical protein